MAYAKKKFGEFVWYLSSVWLPGFPVRVIPRFLDIPAGNPTRIIEDYPGNPGFLPGSWGILESCQEIKNFQDSWLEIQDFPGSQTLSVFTENVWKMWRGYEKILSAYFFYILTVHEKRLSRSSFVLRSFDGAFQSMALFIAWVAGIWTILMKIGLIRHECAVSQLKGLGK